MAANRDFCLVPRTISPFNRVMNVKERQNGPSIGWQIHTKYTPLWWMLLASIFVLFGVADPALLISKNALRSRDVLLGLVPTASVVRSFYEFARPVYEIRHSETKQKLAVGHTGFTKNRHLFQLVARDYLLHEVCTANFDKSGKLIVRWRDTVFHLPPLPLHKRYQVRAGGYNISVSSSKFNLLEVRASASLKFTPLNVFHSRVFCAQVDKSTPTPTPTTTTTTTETSAKTSILMPPRLLMLVLYFWEHNGAVSLLQLATGALFLRFFVSSYRMITHAQPPPDDNANLSDEERLWNARVRNDPHWLKRMEWWYKTRHPRTPLPPRLTKEQIDVLKNRGLAGGESWPMLKDLNYDQLKTLVDAGLLSKPWKTIRGESEKWAEVLDSRNKNPALWKIPVTRQQLEKLATYDIRSSLQQVSDLFRKSHDEMRLCCIEAAVQFREDFTRLTLLQDFLPFHGFAVRQGENWVETAFEWAKRADFKAIAEGKVGQIGLNVLQSFFSGPASQPAAPEMTSEWKDDDMSWLEWLVKDDSNRVQDDYRTLCSRDIPIERNIVQHMLELGLKSLSIVNINATSTKLWESLQNDLKGPDETAERALRKYEKWRNAIAALAQNQSSAIQDAVLSKACEGLRGDKSFTKEHQQKKKTEVQQFNNPSSWASQAAKTARLTTSPMPDIRQWQNYHRIAHQVFNLRTEIESLETLKLRRDNDTLLTPSCEEITEATARKPDNAEAQQAAEYLCGRDRDMCKSKLEES